MTEKIKRVAVVTGAAGGLGSAIVAALKVQGYHVIGLDIENGFDVREPDPQFWANLERLDVLVNCAGINGNSYLEDVTSAHWDAIMNTNAKAVYITSQQALPLLKATQGTILNIVSNAAHVPMTASAAYNASKGAAKILTSQMARELTRRYGITVFSISPNKLAGTGMSEAIDKEVCRTRGWTMEEARDYQMKSLLAGEETSPEALADFIGYLLSTKERHKYLTGCDIPYGL